MKNSLQNVLKENKEKMRIKRREEMIKELIRRNEKMENIIEIAIVIILIAIVGGLFILSSNGSDKAINNCMKKGYSENYCVRNFYGN